MGTGRASAQGDQAETDWGAGRALVPAGQVETDRVADPALAQGVPVVKGQVSDRTGQWAAGGSSVDQVGAVQVAAVTLEGSDRSYISPL